LTLGEISLPDAAALTGGIMDEKRIADLVPKNFEMEC